MRIYLMRLYDDRFLELFLGCHENQPVTERDTKPLIFVKPRQLSNGDYNNNSNGESLKFDTVVQ